LSTLCPSYDGDGKGQSKGQGKGQGKCFAAFAEMKRRRRVDPSARKRRYSSHSGGFDIGKRIAAIQRPYEVSGGCAADDNLQEAHGYWIHMCRNGSFSNLPPPESSVSEPHSALAACRARTFGPPSQWRSGSILVFRPMAVRGAPGNFPSLQQFCPWSAPCPNVIAVVSQINNPSMSSSVTSSG
jgi:hypothetical protein